MKNRIMPLLFLGHGNPMNAIQENEFVHGFRDIVKEIPTPTAIVCVSAHWQTRGIFVTAMENPKTIHDFGGFPQELFDVEYPAKGDPKLANKIRDIIKITEVQLDYDWGIDHGAWSVIKHLYPNANIPVVQLSLDYQQHPQFHYDLAKELLPLRKKGVLIIGSGNLVHNLSIIDWRKLDENFGFQWAITANNKMKDCIMRADYQSLINYSSLGDEFQLAIPTNEHFLPLLYVLALKDEDEKITFFNDKFVGGSLSMTSLIIS